MPDADTTDEEGTMTAAELMRRRRNKKQKKSEPEATEDLDEQIRRLETELEQTDDSDTSDDDDESETTEILVSSELEKERIESLPSTLLPGANVSRGTKRKLKKEKETKEKAPNNVIPKGLQDAVKELLNDYKPRSAERLPFYCRVCARQYNNLDEFDQHKTEQFHQAAVTMERKASFCKLCRKQLTSPAQLQEHLQSKPHRERLANMRSRQPPKHGKQQQHHRVSRQRR